MPKHKQRKEIILFILDVVLLVGALVLAMPVSIRWALWLTCWTVTVVLAQLHFEFPKRTKARVITTAIMVCLFMLAFSLLAYKRWVEEKATALNGELEVPATDRSDVVFQIGAAADGTKITWKGGMGRSLILSDRNCQSAVKKESYYCR